VFQVHGIQAHGNVLYVLSGTETHSELYMCDPRNGFQKLLTDHHCSHADEAVDTKGSLQTIVCVELTAGTISSSITSPPFKVTDPSSVLKQRLKNAERAASAPSAPGTSFSSCAMVWLTFGLCRSEQSSKHPEEVISAPL
jgi:hypothetical protein